MSIKCGNRKRHGDDVVYHDTVALVKACYTGEPSAWDGVARSSGADPMKEAMLPPRPSPQAASTRWESGKPLPFPPGRYAVLADASLPNHVNETVFLKIDAPTEGKWAGYVFVKMQVSDDLINVRSRDLRTTYVNAIINQGPEECMLRYGREIGQCGHCGRTLTNDESREIGIGPVCRGKVQF